MGNRLVFALCFCRTRREAQAEALEFEVSTHSVNYQRRNAREKEHCFPTTPQLGQRIDIDYCLLRRFMPSVIIRTFEKGILCVISEVNMLLALLQPSSPWQCLCRLSARLRRRQFGTTAPSTRLAVILDTSGPALTTLRENTGPPQLATLAERTSPPAFCQTNERIQNPYTRRPAAFITPITVTAN